MRRSKTNRAGRTLAVLVLLLASLPGTAEPARKVLVLGVD